MPWGIAASVAGAVVSSALAPTPSAPTQSASGAADPFAAQRPQYQTALNNLMNGSTPIAADPSYQWRLQQGSENLSRQMASQGLTASGAELAALQDYGQNQASTEYQNQYSRLAQLAGGNIGNPGEAGQIIAGQQNQQAQASSAVGNAIGQGLGQLGQSYFGGGGSWSSGGSSGYSPTYGSGAGGYDMSFGGSTSGFF